MLLSWHFLVGIRDVVYFPGAIKQPLLASFYASMDVFVMPSMMSSGTVPYDQLIRTTYLHRNITQRNYPYLY